MGRIITGKVVGGNRIGRGIGFPTINIPLQEACVASTSGGGSPTGGGSLTGCASAPEGSSLTGSASVTDGVWAGRVYVAGEAYRAMVNIGRNPTVAENGERRLEAHIFDFSGDLYGRTVSVELLKFIRPEQKFSSLEELRHKIEEDKNVINKYFQDNI